MRCIAFLFVLAIVLGACGGKDTTPQVPDKPTFAADIAPIIHKNCTPCHRDDNIAPFRLISFLDVKRRASMVKYVTETRFMPPWPADAGYSHFIGEKVLTDVEIKTIARWVEQGMPAGDTSTVKVPQYVEKAFTNRKPDLVVAMDKSYTIKGDNSDNFLVMRLPYQIAKDTFVKFIEFVPGNRRVIHHMNGNLLSYAPGAKKNLYDGARWVRESWTGGEEGRVKLGMVSEIHQKLGIPNDDGSYPAMTYSVSNYLPGSIPQMYPDGIGGYKLSANGAFYLNDMHYGPTPIDEKDSSYFNIYFDSKPPQRPTGEFILGTLSSGGKAPVNPPLIVPANTIKQFKAERVIDTDISLLTVIPHMHLIGKSFKAYALTPAGDTIRLIKINNWDFRWQYSYTFPKMVKIPKGSRIVAEGVYDNTAQNVNNPYSPPREIRERDGSMRTTDEMFQFICVFVNYKPGDENISLER